MSECVVRMEMPENCECCPMAFTADVPGYHWCAALEQEVEQGLSRPKDCPIICQIPDVHGDLIGREYAIATACSGRIRALPTTEDGEGWIRVNEVRESIKSAPTIVPAERSET